MVVVRIRNSPHNTLASTSKTSHNSNNFNQDMKVNNILVINVIKKQAIEAL